MFEDLEAALGQEAIRRRRLCAFSKWTRTLEDEDRAKAENLVLDEEATYNCRQLARYFQTKGAKLNDQVLVRHRNRRCCGQDA